MILCYQIIILGLIFFIPFVYLLKDDKTADINGNERSVTVKPDTEAIISENDYTNIGYDNEAPLAQNNRIIGGFEVDDINLYPYHVQYGRICGGVIIGYNWVLSVAHCGELNYVRVGSKYRNQGKQYFIEKYIFHPNWKHAFKRHHYDFDYLLLKLNQTLEFSTNVLAIKIAKLKDIHFGLIITVTGFGNTEENSEQSPVLRAMRIPIANKTYCQNLDFQFYRHTLTVNMFCAGYVGESELQDACQGDSGSPAVLNDRLLGLVSFGEGCATPGSLGVYAKVTRVRTWIERTTELKLD